MKFVILHIFTVIVVCVRVIESQSHNYRRIDSGNLGDENYLTTCSIFRVASWNDVVECGRTCNTNACVYFSDFDTGCNMCIDSNHLPDPNWQSLGSLGSSNVYIKTNYVDECASNPCQNGGACEDFDERFRCTCTNGFTGDQCETDVNECDTNNGGCAHNCVNNHGSFSCECNAGYSLDGDGFGCSDINECSSNPCQNGGTCNNNENHYTCSCMNGYSGTRCEVASEIIVLSGSYARLVRQTNMDPNLHNGLYGRLEILHPTDNQWGTVCDDSWDDNDGIVACRMMGYNHVQGSLGDANGDGSLPIILDDLGCANHEQNLWDCPSSGWYQENCSNSEDVAIACY